MFGIMSGVARTKSFIFISRNTLARMANRVPPAIRAFFASPVGRAIDAANHGALTLRADGSRRRDQKGTQ
jgi:hypothetical protein